jgi:hypothetical protein
MAFGRKKSGAEGEIMIDAQIEESAAAAGPENMPVPRSSAVPEASDVRALATKNERELAVRSVAVATAGGLAAGAATIAVAAVAKNIAKPGPGLARRRRKDIVASRSFMVDVHLLKPQR